MHRKQPDRRRWGLVACAVGAASFILIGHARQAQTTFTGTSFRVASEGVNVSSRGFEAGARTHWHTHSAQLLFVKEGRLRYHVEGQPVGEIGLHETTYLPRGVRHWHGATPDEPLTHVSVTFPNDAGEPLPIEWMEPVTDDVYSSGADR